MKNIDYLINECQEKFSIITKMIPSAQLRLRAMEINNLISISNLWSDPTEASLLLKEYQRISFLLDSLQKFQEEIEFYQIVKKDFREDLESILPQVELLLDNLSKFESQQMLRDPIDILPALITINAGSGGSEAANWANILLRMYLRYAEAQGFKPEILDLKPSEEHAAICIDNVSIRVNGSYAYGFLKSETGVHRLIRNSPFNANAARHTSFAAVSVLPDIEDSNINIQIDEKDLVISTMRGSGAGGQNVNKVESAVRIKHLPTNIVINSRSERDQHANRKIAMKMLKAKLYELEMKKKQTEKEKFFSSLQDNSFGHQIRSYTLSPFQLVKDHRTNFEIKDSTSVLDGNIDGFIKAFLQMKL